MNQDPIPSLAVRVLDLFHGVLSDVRFPDADRELLDADAATVREAARAVSEAEDSLRARKEALEAAQRVLRERAQRALSYARIFAESRPDLAGALGGNGAAPAADGVSEVPVRRRRAKKAAPEGSELLRDLAAE